MHRGADPIEGVPTRYWHPLGDGKVQCDLCPRACRLAEGQRGLCFVRANAGEAIVLTTWGRASGFCIDPIEKKPLHHFLPGTPVLSFGTAGCNLTCRFCQNWHISKSRARDAANERGRPERIAAAAERLGCRSVAFTYNEPVVFLEYALDVAAACRERGIRTVAVTAGYIEPEPRAEFFRAMDAANVDLKSFRDDFYRHMSSARLEPVLTTLRYVARDTPVWLEVTNLVIPGANDSETELDELTGWVASELGPDVPVHFSAFHPDYRLLDRPATPPETLRRARAIARRNGVRHAYTGNVRDREGGTTCCHACGAPLIERDGYQIMAWHLRDGACAACGQPLAGVFEARPGDWGARRVPVQVD